MYMSDKNNGGFALLACFIALGASAVIAFITYLLPLAGVEGADGVLGVLQIILQISLFIGVVFGAFAFAGRRGLITKILLFAFVTVFAAAIILGIINIANAS